MLDSSLRYATFGMTLIFREVGVIPRRQLRIKQAGNDEFFTDGVTLSHPVSKKLVIGNKRSAVRNLMLLILRQLK